jgi:hypothetical protein
LGLDAMYITQGTTSRSTRPSSFALRAAKLVLAAVFHSRTKETASSSHSAIIASGKKMRA